jgi:endonuclease/exonuclease/phosphatase family metal-dependent hydrolase
MTLTRVISYNIRHNDIIDTLHGNGWTIRRDRVFRLISIYDSDIIVLIEVSIEYITDIIEQFSKYNFYMAPVKSKSNDIMILWKRDMFSCLGVSEFWLSDNPTDQKVPSWSGKQSRVLLRVELISMKGTRFYVYGTHFENPHFIPKLNSAVLTNNIVTSEGGNYILTGDFNFFKDQPRSVYNILSNGLTDIRSEETEHDGTWVGWEYDLTHDPSVSVRLDHGFTNFPVISQGVLNIKIADDIILPSDKLWSITPYPSDHLPIIFDTEI